MILLLGLGLFTGLLFAGTCVSFFLQGVAGVCLAGLGAFTVSLIGTLARRNISSRLKFAVYTGAIIGLLTGVILIRWQSLELHHRVNQWAVFIVPVAAITGRAFGANGRAAWVVNYFRFINHDSHEITSPQVSDDIPDIWVAKSVGGNYVVFDQSIQPGNASPFVYCYNLSTQQLNRIHREDVDREYTVVSLIEIQLPCIRAYKKWKKSLGDETIQDIVADAEKGK